MPRFSYPRRVPAWAPIIMTVTAAWVVHSAIQQWRQVFFDFDGEVYSWARGQFLLHGISRAIAIKCAWFLSYSPNVVLYFLLGAILGFIASERWRGFTALFVVSLILMPYLLGLNLYIDYVRGYGWSRIGYGALTQITCIVPTVFLGAWLASQPRKRRRERRREAGLCEACGYSLAGNTTGVCPECGTRASVEPSMQ